MKARVIAWSAAGVAAVFAAAAPFWDRIAGAISLPPPLELTGRWSWVSLYPWAALGLSALGAVALGLALMRRGAMARCALMAAVMLGAIVLYLPFLRLTASRIDRIRGSVEEPARAWRLLAAAVITAVAAHAVLIAVASMRHTPAYVRTLARVALVLTCGLFLHFLWFFMVVPVTDVWYPAEWDRPDRLRPFAACRGATLWQGRMQFGRIDDLWTSFRDPRGGTGRAVSIEGTSREGYFWLTLPEAAEFRVRADDPAVVNCDRRWRRDPVAPASWHTLGARKGGL